jgi:uncharacterized protein YuzE
MLSFVDIDREHDLIYILLRPELRDRRGAVAQSFRVAEDIVLDLDESGRLIGIELLNASSRLDMDDLETGTRDIIVGVAEAAAMLGVERSNFVRDHANKPDFPAPIAELASGRFWLRSAVERHMEKGKKTHVKNVSNGVRVEVREMGPGKSEPKTTETLEPPSGARLAVRCHDVTVSLRDRQVGDFDQLVVLGMAVRLALHLRGVPAVRYDLLRQVALHLLHIPPTTLPAVVETLAEVEFIRIDREGKTIRSIVPTVPYYDDLFEGIGEVSQSRQLSEPEALTLAMVDRLSKAPAPRETLLNAGGDTKLVKRMIDVGSDGGYLITKRARGRDMVVSPIYFHEHADAFVDLAAAAGSANVAQVVGALSRNQGWPLKLALRLSRIGDTSVSPEQLRIVVALAGDGFAPPPAIDTSYSGTNFFLFAPKPGLPRLAPEKKPIYEGAMALVAAVRQGQLLPRRIRIRSPLALLQALRDRKYLRANSEALEQYRRLVVLRLGHLRPTSAGWARFELIDQPENVEAVDMAIALVKGEEPAPNVEEDVVLAFRKGEAYIESLVGRQMLKEQHKVKLSAELEEEIDNLLLRGAL